MDSLYFIRIGGTAMGGVAAACQAMGMKVFGSEETLYEPMKGYLAEAGVRVFPHFDAKNLQDADPDGVVVGNAVSRGNEELEAAMEDRRTLLSLPQVVSERLLGRNKSVVVTGTHGKTTTTAMAVWLLESAGRGPGFMVGGVPGNLPVSCRPVPKDIRDIDRGIFVIEGDEYDSAFFDKRSKFLWYRPTIAILNNLEFDHADIFPDLEAIKQSFRLFLRLVPANGLVLVNNHDQNLEEILTGYSSAPVESFGFKGDATWQARHIRLSRQATQFEVWKEGEILGEVSLSASGDHNVLNMLAAIAQASTLGVDFPAIQTAVASFLLPKRRMELLPSWRGAEVIDDFAHHPTAIRATIAAVRDRHPNQRLFVVFEPRSNSTTRNLFETEFETCFEGATGVFLGALDRPERYDASKRLDTTRLASVYRAKGMLADSITIEQGADGDWGKYVIKALGAWCQPGDVILLGSNGDLGGLRQMLLQDR